MKLSKLLTLALGATLLSSSAFAEMVFQGRAFVSLNYGSYDFNQKVAAVVAHVGIRESSGQWVSVSDVRLAPRADGHFFGKALLAIPSYWESSRVRPTGAYVAYQVKYATGQTVWKGPFQIPTRFTYRFFTGEGCPANGIPTPGTVGCYDAPLVNRIEKSFELEQDWGRTESVVVETYNGT